MGAIGQPLLRKEDIRLLTGKGRFSDDFSMEGQAYAVMVRSPHPHARIARVHAAPALSMAGVLGVFSGADCLADGLGPIPHSPVPQTRYDMKLTAPRGGKIFIGSHLLLPVDKARHVGEAVAMVVAETLAQAFDAAEAVEIDYEVLPWNTNSEVAFAGGTPPVWDDVPGNVLVNTIFGDAIATDSRFCFRCACDPEGLPHRPRYRGPTGAAGRLGAIRHTNAEIHALCRKWRCSPPEA